MDKIVIKRSVNFIEDTTVEMGQVVTPPLRKVAAAVVINNPFAGRYEQDLTPLMDFGGFLGDILTKRAVELLDLTTHDIKGYGKATIVGISGEIEHGAALIHPQMGKPLRAAVGGGSAIIPSTKKRAAAEAPLDIPFFFKDDQWRMPYLDGFTIVIPAAPAPDEIVVAIALSSGPRPLARIGGDEPETDEARARRSGSTL